VTWAGNAVFAVLLAAGVWALVRPESDSEQGSAGAAIISKVFGFFGIGGISETLGIGVWLSTSAVAGAVLNIIAALHLGRAYPAWFLANAIASGLVVGLVATRVVAASYSGPDGPSSDSNTP
jgi:hypothetical protein